MNYSGSIVEYAGKRLYVFGTAKLVTWSDEFPDTYQIGINLDTGKVDDIKSEYVSVLGFHELNEVQQTNLGLYIPIYHKLKRNVMTVSAKARAGKDTLAKEILERCKGVGLVALGDAIKDVRNLLFGVPENKDRPSLIMIGQGLRKEDPNIWIKVWLTRVINLIRKGKLDKVICQDVRQPNEFTFFTSLGALTVKIEADEAKRLEKIRELDGEEMLDEKLLNDETETHVDGFDANVTVFNNYDEQFAKHVVSKVLPELLERGW